MASGTRGTPTSGLVAAQPRPLLLPHAFSEQLNSVELRILPLIERFLCEAKIIQLIKSFPCAFELHSIGSAAAAAATATASATNCGLPHATWRSAVFILCKRWLSGHIETVPGLIYFIFWKISWWKSRN